MKTPLFTKRSRGISDSNRENATSDVTNQGSGEISDDLLEGVVGGQGISFLTKLPNYRGPKLQVPGSIAQGDTLDNTLTFDELP